MFSRIASGKRLGAISRKLMLDRCDALYICHRDPIFRMALRMVGGDRAWAFELLESCMARAFRHIGRFEDVRSSRSKSILTAFLQSAVNDVYQQAWARAGIAEASGGYLNPTRTKKDKHDVHQILIRNELSSGLAQYVERLTQREKELVFFRYYANLAEEELRARFQLEPEELRDALFLIKQKMARMIIEGQIGPPQPENHRQEMWAEERQITEGREEEEPLDGQLEIGQMAGQEPL